MSDIDYHPPPFKHWMKHFAAVPKGFLRYYVLRLLNEKPMSGSEIMEEVGKRTKGSWKPSPGSIYPLMAWLQDNGYVKEVPEQEAGMKRYILTERGKEFLKEHLKKRDELREKFIFFMQPFPMPPPLELLSLNFYPQKIRELVETLKKLARALWSLRSSLRKKYSEKAVAEAREVIERATREIEEIVKKLKESESENAHATG